MELSAITKEYNVPLTRSERNLLLQLPASTSALSEDRYTQQLKALAEARTVVTQLPDRQTSERQRRMEKAAMLKERLKILRQMIPFLSPSGAKSLKTEMKQIAAQIASLGGGSGSATPTTETAAAEVPESKGETESKEDTAPSRETEQVDDGDQQKQQTSSDGTVHRLGPSSTDGTSEDRRLQEAVEELKSLYKTVSEALKRKQQTGYGGEPSAKHAPHLQVYSAMPDNMNNVAIKA